MDRPENMPDPGAFEEHLSDEGIEAAAHALFSLPVYAMDHRRIAAVAVSAYLEATTERLDKIRATVRATATGWDRPDNELTEYGKGAAMVARHILADLEDE